MNTTTAAQQAGVTTDTIRTWARMGAIRATKTRGRWNIDTRSLAKRTAMGIRRTRKATVNNTHTCGHEGHIRYRGRNQTRPLHPKLDRPCPTCRQADRALATEALRTTLAELRAGLPTITNGSPKQNEWATRIRDNVFADPDQPGAEEYTHIGPVTMIGQPDGVAVAYSHDDTLIALEQDLPTGPITGDQARQLIRTQLTTTSARWWIDNQ